MSPANNNSFTFPFQFGFLLFFSSCLIAVAKTSSTMLNKSGESRRLCPVPYFKGNTFIFLLAECNVGCGFVIVVHVVLRYVLFIPTLLRVFIINELWILSNASAFIDDYMIFIFQFVYVVYCVY